VALYLEHFGLTEPPFRITPHTDFFFDGADRGATLEALIRCRARSAAARPCCAAC
jgi:MSHA biogenesis protein MshM